MDCWKDLAHQLHVDYGVIIYGQVSIKDLSRNYLILEMKMYSDKELE